MENKKPRYILYGASFNPPHIGHYSAICQMLEQYDTVIVYPYPKQYNEFGKESLRPLPPIHHRMKMLNLFLNDFFPQIQEQIVLENLATGVRKDKDLYSKQVIHTIDYLEYVQKIYPDAEIHACMGLEEDRAKRKTNFHREDEIVEKFGTFELETSKSMNSQILRKFFSKIQNTKASKNEKYIHQAVGRSVTEYIFTNNLYGLSEDNRPTISKTKPKI